MCDNRNNFCFICGLFVDSKHKTDISESDKIIQLYEEYFGKMVLRKKWYIPTVYCSTCYSILRKWKSKKYGNTAMPFIAPMIWLPVVIHIESNCYFCATNIYGYHFKIRHTVKYADVETVIKPMMRELDDPIPSTQQNVSPIHSIEDVATTSSCVTQSEFIPQREQTAQHLVSQGEYNDLVRDLELSKRKAEILGSRLKQWNYLETEVCITSRRGYDSAEFRSLFTLEDENANLVYCNDINALFQSLNQDHNPIEWRLFIDGSTKSLKAVLMHNENSLPSLPLAYGTNIKESYDTMRKILNLINYETHKWKKIVAENCGRFQSLDNSQRYSGWLHKISMLFV